MLSYETVLNLHWKTTLFVIGVTSYVTSQRLFPLVYSQLVSQCLYHTLCS